MLDRQKAVNGLKMHHHLISLDFDQMTDNISKQALLLIWTFVLQQPFLAM